MLAGGDTSSVCNASLRDRRNRALRFLILRWNLRPVAATTRADALLEGESAAATLVSEHDGILRIVTHEVELPIALQREHEGLPRGWTL